MPVNRVLRAKAFDVTNVFLLLEKHVDMSPQLFNEFYKKFQHDTERVFRLCKNSECDFWGRDRKGKTFSTNQQIGAGFVNTELCLLKVRAKLSPRVGVC